MMRMSTATLVTDAMKRFARWRCARSRALLVFIFCSVHLCIARAQDVKIATISSPREILIDAALHDASKTTIFLDFDRFLAYYVHPDCAGKVTTDVNRAYAHARLKGFSLKERLKDVEHLMAFPRKLADMPDEEILFFMSTYIKFKIGEQFAVLDEAILGQISDLKHRGYDVKLLTSRDEIFHQQITRTHLKTSRLEEAGLTIDDVIFCGVAKKFLAAKKYLLTKKPYTQLVYFGDDDVVHLTEFAEHSQEFPGMTLNLYWLSQAEKLCSSLCNDTPSFDTNNIDDFVDYFRRCIQTYTIDQELTGKMSAGMIRVFELDDGTQYIIYGLRFGGKAKLSIGGAREPGDKTFRALIERELSEEYFSRLPLKDVDVAEHVLVSGGQPFFTWTRYVTFFAKEKGYAKSELEEALLAMNKNAQLYTDLVNYMNGFAEDRIPHDAEKIAADLLGRLMELARDLDIMQPRTEVRNMLAELQHNSRALASSIYANDGKKFAKDFLHDRAEYSIFVLQEFSAYLFPEITSCKAPAKFDEDADKRAYEIFSTCRRDTLQ